VGHKDSHKFRRLVPRQRNSSRCNAHEIAAISVEAETAHKRQCNFHFLWISCNLDLSAHRPPPVNRAVTASVSTRAAAVIVGLRRLANGSSSSSFICAQVGGHRSDVFMYN